MTERTIFLQALEREGEAARTAYLADACGTDTELRQRVEQLLQSHSDAGSFLGQPVLGSSVTSDVTPGGETETHSPDVAAGQVTLDFLTPSDKPNSLGRLDHYEVMDIVGRGGMGIVLRAFDEKLHRVVALKVMTRDIAGNAAARKRFSREAKAAAAVVHDHIVPIHAIEESDPTPYLVMQFIEGQSLQQKIEAEGSLELKEILRIGTQIASGLAAAHKQGLVHRDIKPSNILLENGVQRVKITDFGLARAVDDASVSQSGIVAGTPQYMSPEQADGQPVDHRSDLFSLGSVLYAMCTGRPPFRAASTVATLKRVCEDTPRPIRELNPDMPEWLSEIIAKLHAKSPADRYQSAKEVAEELERHLAAVQKPDSATTPLVATSNQLPDVKPWEERMVRWMAGILAVGGIIQLVFFAAWLSRGRLFGWAAGACAVAMGVLVLYFAFYLIKLRRTRRRLRRPPLSAVQQKQLGVAIGFAIVVVIMIVATLPYLFWPHDDGNRRSVPPPNRTSVRQLQQLINLQEVNVDRIKRRLDAGVAAPPELVAAEIELIEARIRLAEAITDKRELGLLLNQIVTKREEQLKLVEIKFAAGAIAQGEVDEAKKRVIEARLRLPSVSGEQPSTTPQQPDTTELQRLVTLQEKAVATAKLRINSGIESFAALTAEEIRLIEARMRLAEAQGQSKDVERLLAELVELREEQLTQAKNAHSLHLLGPELDRAQKLIDETRLRLKKLSTSAQGLLKGRWVAVSAEYQGRQIPDAEAKDMFPTEMVISTNGQYGITWSGKQHEGTLTTDGSKTPGEIDFSGSVFAGLKPRKAIYNVDKDQLTLCLSFVGPNADPPRPTEFKTDSQSKDAVLTYRRAKD